MKWPRRRKLPRIHSSNARHDWVVGLDPDSLFGAEVAMLCRRCGQCPRTTESDLFRTRHATGCAGHKFRGRYRPGDEVEADNTAYRFVRYQRGGMAVVQEIGGWRRVRCLAVVELEPTLAGPVEAEKRRQAHLAQLAREGKFERLRYTVTAHGPNGEQAAVTLGPVEGAVAYSEYWTGPSPWWKRAWRKLRLPRQPTRRLPGTSRYRR